MRRVCTRDVHAVATPAAVRKQIAVRRRRTRSTCSWAKTTSRSRRWPHEFAELVEEGLRAFNVERIHAGDMTTGDRLADGVAVASSPPCARCR